jgi:hypothetical protein
MAAQHQPRALVAGETESACTYQDSSRLHLPRGQYERTLSAFLPEVRDVLYM